MIWVYGLVALVVGMGIYHAHEEGTPSRSVGLAFIACAVIGFIGYFAEYSIDKLERQAEIRADLEAGAQYYDPT